MRVMNRRVFLLGGAQLLATGFFANSLVDLATAKENPDVAELVWAEPRPAFQTAFVRTGIEKGFFEEANVKLTVQHFESDDTILRGMIAGQIAIAHITPAGPLAAIEKGAKLKIIGSFNPGTPHILFSKPEIHSIKALVGKSVATGNPGDFLSTILLLLFQKFNVNKNKVNIVSVGGSKANIQALMGGRVDAAVSKLDYLPFAEKAGLKPIAYVAEELPNLIRLTLIVPDKVIKENRDGLQRAFNALTKGFRYFLDHKDEAADLAVKITGGQRSFMEFQHDWYKKRKMFTPDLYLSHEAINFMQKLNLDIGRQKKILPIEKVADYSFQKNMIKELGHYKGSYRR